jgi:NAD(P)-dependent dehydrogenase (short-subunit alcohol dehydrogenase family)
MVVVGADGGLGHALASRLWGVKDAEMILVCGTSSPGSVAQPLHDFSQPGSALAAAELIRKETSELIANGQLDKDYYPVLINCVGTNYIEWFPDLDMAKFDELMAINVKSHIELVQHLICDKAEDAWLREVSNECPANWFNGSGALCEIISNASHMPMTNSVIYNATKGAQHIATLALGRELKKTHNLTVFGVSPNKLAGTGMSKYIESRVPELRGWTPKQAEDYQLASLAAGEETTPEALADFLHHLVRDQNNHKFLANTVIPFGA